MTTCPTCGYRIAEDAFSCPYCGKRNAGELGVRAKEDAFKGSIFYIIFIAPYALVFEMFKLFLPICIPIFKWMFFTRYGLITLAILFVLSKVMQSQNPPIPSITDSTGRSSLDYAKTDEIKVSPSEFVKKSPNVIVAKKDKKLPSNSEKPSSNSVTTGIIIGEGVRMRSSMDKTSRTNIIDGFSKGTQVEILERNGEWVKARCNGKVGYIFAEFVQYLAEEEN